MKELSIEEIKKSLAPQISNSLELETEAKIIYDTVLSVAGDLISHNKNLRRLQDENNGKITVRFGIKFRREEKGLASAVCSMSYSRAFKSETELKASTEEKDADKQEGGQSTGA